MYCVLRYLGALYGAQDTAADGDARHGPTTDSQRYQSVEETDKYQWNSVARSKQRRHEQHALCQLYSTT